MKKILTVIGARPQFIKAAPVSKILKKQNRIKEIMVHTGQHYHDNMSKIFFEELEIAEPKYNLEIGSGTHAYQTGEMLKRLESVVISEKPDLVLIYGDTNSTLAGALVSSKLHIPIAHVESGLRSFNRRMPEEINRVIADHLSSMLFCPTKTAIENLRKEGITKNVYFIGDVMYDVAIMFKNKAQQQSKIISKLNLKSKNYILVTIHRAENTDDKKRLLEILKSLEYISQKFEIIFPIHPRTKKMINFYDFDKFLKNIKIIEPAGFLDMICLENNAMLILTDSGGVQKEAYFHKVPCVTLREETEWIETIKANWNFVVKDIKQEKILKAIKVMLDNNQKRNNISDYGKGEASKMIVEKIKEFLK